MSIPGMNLLSTAMSIIKPTKIPYYSVTGTRKNELFQTVDDISLIGDILASVQPIPRKRYSYYGLDFSKHYVTVWFRVNPEMLSLMNNSGFIVWRGRKMQFVENVDWFEQDGWTRVVGVDVGEFA